MKELQKTKFVATTPKGSLKIRDCFIFLKNRDIAVLCVQTNSRNYEIISYGSDSADMPDVVCESKGSCTVIKFPEWKGWDCWGHTGDKDDFYITLIRRKAVDNLRK